MSSASEGNLSHFRDDPVGLMELADVTLVAEGQGFPTHSHILAVHSSVFRKTIRDLGSTPAKSLLKVVFPGYGKIIQMGEGVRAKEVKLLMSWLYEARRSEISRKMEDIASLAKLSEMYDMPLLQDWCEADLCNKAKYMHFRGQHFANLQEDIQELWGAPDESSIWNATEWLAFANRLGLEKLMAACITVVVNGLHRIDVDGIGLVGIRELIKEHSFSAESALSIALACRNITPFQSVYEKRYTSDSYYYYDTTQRLKQYVGDLGSPLCNWLRRN